MFHYTRREADGTEVTPCLVRPAAAKYLETEGHGILVGLKSVGPKALALVEPEMIFDEDADEEKGLVWNVYSVDADDPRDIRDGNFWSDGATPEQALEVAEEWIREHTPPTK